MTSLKHKTRDDVETGRIRKGKSDNKMLSCQRCRLRKVKCNYEYPCSNCVKIKAECIRVTSDKRKKRPPASYVLKLEKAVDKFSSFFQKLKDFESTQQKHDLLENTDLNALLSGGEYRPANEFEVLNADESSDDRAIYGPTSVYDDNLIPHSSKVLKSDESSIKLLNKDPEVLECLKLFFKWQYPDHNMFLFRESFLTDFFSPKPDSLYCSRVLVLCVCALGSRMSSDDNIYGKSLRYYNEAKSSLLSSFNQPSITSLQSFLLLAFYDICNGFNSSGWMLSGNAMRMGFDLGFQLNPEVWFFKSKDDLTPLDTAIRSRIYWGCYVADHFISLLLGRPSSLKMSDATIPETQNLPDLAWIKDYAYSEPLENVEDTRNISNPLKKMINLINISDNMLNDIFTKTEFESKPSNNEDLNLVSRLEKLDEYNIQIMNWKKSLPPDLQWDIESLKVTADNPTMSSIRYYYYILILCLNRPFIGITKKATSSHELEPSVICKNAIEDLYVAIKRFISVHGLRRASVFIVYCSILSISVMLLDNPNNEFREKADKLHFFMDTLKGCSKTWKLAEKSHTLIESKLNSRQTIKNGKQHRSPATVYANTNNFAESQYPLELSYSNNGNPYNQRGDDRKLNSHPVKSYERSPGSQSVMNVSLVSNDNGSNSYFKQVDQDNANILFDDNLDFFGGPPVLMTSDLFNEDWESLFPDSIFKN